MARIEDPSHAVCRQRTPEEEAALAPTMEFFIAPDGVDEPTIWATTSDPDRPRALARKCELDPLIWNALTDRIPDRTEPRLCEAVVMPATLLDPPAYCEEEAEKGSDYCARHNCDEPDPDRAWKERRRG